MTIANSHSALINRPAPLCMRELADDLEAVWPRESDDVAQWMTRPSILRRIAGELASQIAPDIDRIVVLGPGAMALGSAVSLVTGLPFCAVQADGSRFGNSHAGEMVAIVSAGALVQIPEWAATMQIGAQLCVIAESPPETRLARVSPIFTVRENRGGFDLKGSKND